MKKLSLVVPVYFEEDCIGQYLKETIPVLENIPNIDWEIVFIDDGSRDRTQEIIKEKAASESRIKLLEFSYNKGKQAAVSAGIRYASGDYLLYMDTDLQDPPEVLHAFIEKYEEGYEQVVAKIVRREHVPFVRKVLSNWFYIFANKATGNVIPRGVSDFRLLSRPAYLAARKMQERNRFLRGLIAWTGFRTAVVDIQRPARFAGESKFNQLPIRHATKWALSAILAHTTLYCGKESFIY